MLHASLNLPMEKIREICRRYHVRELAIFGSAVRGDFRPDSDVDFLVEFEPEAHIGLSQFMGLREELSALVRREVDLGTKRALKPMIRDEVLGGAEVLYAA